MDISKLSIGLGIIILILSIVAIIVPFNSPEVSYATYWAGSAFFILTGLFTIITGARKEESLLKTSFSFGVIFFILLLFSSISGIEYNKKLIFIDQLELYIQIFIFLFYFIPPFFIGFGKLMGFGTYRMFYTYSIAELVLSSIGFFLMTLIFILFITNKLPMREKIRPVKRRIFFRRPRTIRKEPKKVIPEHCPRCKAPLSKKSVDDLKNRKFTECEYCGSALTIDDYYQF